MTDDSLQANAARFATTRWSLVVAAARRSTPESARALASLCELYWYPLYAYAYRRVNNVHEAEELTQAFYVELLERKTIDSADPVRGRFRAFLITAFKHFLSKEWDKAKAQKRGGGRPLQSLDFAEANSRLASESMAGRTPEEIYQRKWAILLLDQTLHRLRSEFQQAGKSEMFQALQEFLVDRGQSYRKVAKSLGMTEGAVKMTVSRMRKRYRELIRDEVAQTVADPADVEDELRDLFSAVEF
jgi:RNA polymerase sigma-70 factor (ECF subfamily)